MPTLADALRGYQPPTESALADPIVEHFRTLPQQLATNQQAMDNTMASMYKTDMATGQPNPNYRPEAMNEFTQMMPMVGALTAWHGTPHKIKGLFDINKTGSGSGIDYGYGTYFSELPETAKGYMSFPNKTDTKGNLYKVDIPDKFLPKMINWSSSEQTPEVSALLKKAGLPTNARGEDIYFAAIEKAGSSDAEKSGFQKATEYLNTLGIKGITYPQRSYESDAVSKNFVVFDPSKVKILEENAKPVARKKLIQQQIDKIE